MNYEQPVANVEKEHRCGLKCMSWSAVIAGAVIAIGLTFLLNLFGVAIGLTAYTNSAEGVKALAIGGYIGMVIGIMIIMFVSGCVSGFLGRAYCTTCNLGVLYGFATWSLALIFSILLASSVGQFMAMQYEALTNPNTVAVKISSGSPMSSMFSTDNTTSKNTASTKGGNNQVTVTDEEAAKALGKTVFLIFLLFIVGALAAAFGGYIGMGHCGSYRKDIPARDTRDPRNIP